MIFTTTEKALHELNKRLERLEDIVEKLDKQYARKVETLHELNKRLESLEDIVEKIDVRPNPFRKKDSRWWFPNWF